MYRITKNRLDLIFTTFNEHFNNSNHILDSSNHVEL